MELDRESLRKQLEPATPKARAWFAWRCALRALPILIHDPNPGWGRVPFGYWGKDSRKRLQVIFLAVDFAGYRNEKGKPGSFLSRRAAAAAALRLRISGVETAIRRDIESLTDHTDDFPLWPDGCPPEITELEGRFVRALQDVGFGYWADEYRCWTRGEFDEARFRRRTELTEEIIAAGPDAVLAFLEAKDTKRLAEARVILLGDGGAGKTSIIRRLHGEDLQPAEEPTPGVTVREEEEIVAGKPLRVHFWDFGGQVFLHATHQLFLRERCVNLVVLKARETGEREMAEYWLEHIRVFGGGSPTIIVQNHVDALAKGMQTPMPFDPAEITRRYPFVIGCLNLSCSTVAGLEALRAAVFDALADRRILDEQTVPSWFDLKERLRAELSGKEAAHIDQCRFEELCHEAEVPAEQRDAALATLDQLGVALHFRNVDPDWFILDPSWLTHTIYHLLWRANEDELHGALTVEMLRRIFDPKKNPKAPVVPDNKLPSLLKLLVAFGLAYEHRPGSFRVPMLAPEREPAIQTPEGESIGFRVKMDTLLPPMVFHRFVTECGAEITGDRLWRHGCLLASGGAQALVRMVRLERVIEFQVWGEPGERGRFLTVLRTRLLELLGKDFAYQNLGYTPRITVEERDFGWRETLGSFLNNAGFVPDSRGALVPILGVLQPAYGPDQLSMNKVLEEMSMMNRDLISAIRGFAEKPSPPILVNASPTIDVSPHIQMEANQTLNIIQNIQNLVRLKSGVEDLDYEIDRLKLEGAGIAAAKTDIAELRKLIDGYKANQQSGPVADTERETLMGRIKRVGKRLVDGLGPIDTLASICKNVVELIDKLQG
jgi:GTPase SAR1 family protein